MMDGSHKGTEPTDSADWLAEAGALTVRVTASDAGGGAERIRLADNGKIAGENRRGIGIKAAVSGFEQYFSVPLADGENRLSEDRVP